MALIPVVMWIYSLINHANVVDPLLTTYLLFYLDSTLPVSLITSLEFFAIETWKNISAAAHDKYVNLCNSIFKPQLVAGNAEGRSRRRRDIWGKPSFNTVMT